MQQFGQLSGGWVVVVEDKNNHSKDAIEVYADALYEHDTARR